MNIRQEVKHLKSQLKQSGNATRAKQEKAYQKSPHSHYGVNVPTIRTIARTWLKNKPSLSIDEVTNIVAVLWDSDWFEERSLAVILLEYRKKQLEHKHLQVIEHMINTATGWGHLDGIAVWLIGALIDNDQRTLKRLPTWAHSQNFWVRRTAVLAQITQFRRGQGDVALFESIITPMLNEEDNWSKQERFFIRKAIGWALRELAPKKPKWVFSYIKRNKKNMSGLTFRESSRKLPPAMRKSLTMI